MNVPHFCSDPSPCAGESAAEAGGTRDELIRVRQLKKTIGKWRVYQQEIKIEWDLSLIYA